MRTCGVCGIGREHFTIQEYKFPYGAAGPDQVELKTPMVVWCCDNTPECGEMTMDWVGELIIEHTIKMWHLYLQMQEEGHGH